MGRDILTGSIDFPTWERSLFPNRRHTIKVGAYVVNFAWQERASLVILHLTAAEALLSTGL